MLFLLFLLVSPLNLFSQDDEPDSSIELPSKNTTRTVKGALIGGAETLLSNGVLTLYNYSYYLITGHGSWALPRKDSVQYNLTVPWFWEHTDGFIVNNLGHLTQGAMYYTAGRVNSFGYYDSAFFSAFGSFTWEAFGESNEAAINDSITTLLSAQVVGEILYRLYLEARAAGVPAPIAFFINPMAGFHYLVTRQKPPDNGRNLYGLRAYLGMGYGATHSSVTGISDELYSFRGLYGYAGFGVIYGNPFEQESRVPFNQFEFNFSAGFNGFTIGSSYTNLRLDAHGYILSWSPVYTDNDRMSTGLSMHLDYASLGIFDESCTINQFGWALDWTTKYQHIFSQDTAMQIKLHSGITSIGSAKYYSPEEDREFLNYGAGLNSKFYLNLEHKKWGKLEIGTSGHVMWLLPGTSDVSYGTYLWLFTDVTYSYFFTNHLSVGITESFALERGYLGNFPNIRKWDNSVKLFFAWNR
jgi:hypothetical protein